MGVAFAFGAGSRAIITRRNGAPHPSGRSPQRQCPPKDSATTFFSMPLHTTKFPLWQLPSINCHHYRAPHSRPIVFLCPLAEAQSSEILEKLCSVDQTWAGDCPDATVLKVQRVVAVPWLRDSAPSSASISSVIIRMSKSAWAHASMIFIDGQSIVDGTAIVVNNLGQTAEAARVPMNRANLILSAAEGTSLAQFIPGFEKIKIVSEEESSLAALKVRERSWEDCTFRTT